MQKRENTRSSTASVSSSPVISPSARIASRRSMVQKSQGMLGRHRLAAGQGIGRPARQVPLPFVQCQQHPCRVPDTTAIQQSSHQSVFSSPLEC